MVMNVLKELCQLVQMVETFLRGYMERFFTFANDSNKLSSGLVAQFTHDNNSYQELIDKRAIKRVNMVTENLQKA